MVSETSDKKGTTWNLTLEQCGLIMENCFSNLFVTDGRGVIIYANSVCSEVLGVPIDQLLSMSVDELFSQGYVSHSYTKDALRTGRQATGSYYTKAGREVATVCTPVLGENGRPIMAVTYSHERDSLGAFIRQIEHQKRQIETYKDTIAYLNNKTTSYMEGLVVRDPQMVHIVEMLKKLAPTDGTIMLYGESGVGKEMLAKYIRNQSTRDRNIFVPLNCATIPADLIESELFGYEKGAFTGASRDGKRGLFEIANGGTIFLDEIGELTLSAQSKLLRVLESGEFRRVGGDKVLTTDVRIIGATNRDLKQMIQEKTFRADLYYRLNVFPIEIPPLRERPADMDGLTELFLESYNRKLGRDAHIPQAMMEDMHRYRWPGNVRELRNVVERFVITGEISLTRFGAGESVSPSFQMSAVHTDLPLKEFTRRQELAYIKAALEECGGSAAKAAEKLGIHRSVLYRKLQDARNKNEKDGQIVAI